MEESCGRGARARRRREKSSEAQERFLALTKRQIRRSLDRARRLVDDLREKLAMAPPIRAGRADGDGEKAALNGKRGAEGAQRQRRRGGKAR
jgi:hypothetical protein